MRAWAGALRSSSLGWSARGERRGERRLEPRRVERGPPFAWLLARLSREGRALCALTAVALLFGGNPGQTHAYILLLATASLLSSALLFTRAFRLRQVRATLHVPRRVSVGDHALLRVELESAAEREYRRLRVEAPRLPRQLSLSEPAPEIAKLEAHGRASAALRVRFATRGCYELGPFRAAALLPLGLSQGPAVTTRKARVVVVPRIACVTSLPGGRHARSRGNAPKATRSTGESELVGVRPYRPGDPIRQLHARSWARHAAPMVREYHEHHTARVAVVVDVDAHAGSARVEAALSLAAGLIARSCHEDVAIALLSVGERWERLPPAHAALDRALELLALARAGRAFDVERVRAHLAPELEQLSQVLLVSVTWTASHAALATELERCGVHLEAFVVAEHRERTRHATLIPLEAITSGRELAL